MLVILMKIFSASATVMLTFYDKKTEKSKQSIYALFLMYSQIGTVLESKMMTYILMYMRFRNKKKYLVG